jgi:hypothetical protein
MKLYYCLIIIFFINIIGIANAEESGGTLIGKQNDCIQLPQECADCSYIKLTSIQYPNMSRENINTIMTKNESSFNYSFCDTSLLGNYVYCMVGDVGGTDTVACKDFEITATGKSNPDGILVLVFIVFFLLLLGLLAFLMINVILYFATLRSEKRNGVYKEQLSIFGAKPLIFNLSVYLVLLGYYAFELFYLGNPLISRFMPIIIFISSITNVIFPIIAFVISIGFAGWNAVTNSIGGAKRYG